MPALPHFLPFPHSGNYDICYGGVGGEQGRRGGGRETGTRVKGKGGFIVNERPAHPCTSMAKKKKKLLKVGGGKKTLIGT